MHETPHTYLDCVDCDDGLICCYNLADCINYAHGKMQVRESGASVPVGQLEVELSCSVSKVGGELDQSLGYPAPQHGLASLHLTDLSQQFEGRQGIFVIVMVMTL